MIRRALLEHLRSWAHAPPLTNAGVTRRRRRNSGGVSLLGTRLPWRNEPCSATGSTMLVQAVAPDLVGQSDAREAERFRDAAAIPFMPE